MREALYGGRAFAVRELAHAGDVHALAAVLEYEMIEQVVACESGERSPEAAGAAAINEILQLVAQGVLTPIQADSISLHIERTVRRIRRRRIGTLLAMILGKPPHPVAEPSGPPQPALPRATDAAPSGAPSRRPVRSPAH